MLSAAVSGLLSGSTVTLHAAGRSASISSPNLGQVASAASLNQADKDKHSCKGKNECKGTGGCKSGDNGNEVSVRSPPLDVIGCVFS